MVNVSKASGRRKIAVNSSFRQRRCLRHDAHTPVSAQSGTAHDVVAAVAAFFFLAFAFFLLLSRGFNSVIPALHVSAYLP